MDRKFWRIREARHPYTGWDLIVMQLSGAWMRVGTFDTYADAYRVVMDRDDARRVAR